MATGSMGLASFLFRVFEAPVMPTAGLFLAEVGYFHRRSRLARQGSAATTLASAGTSNVLLARPRVRCVQSMSDTTIGGSAAKWHLYHIGQYLKPYVFQARQPLRSQVKGAEDIEFNHFKVMTEARYNIGYLAWWTAVETTFT